MARQYFRHRSPKKGQECRVYILFLNWHSKDGQAMLPGYLRNVCQRNSSMENWKWANAPMMFRRSDTKTPSKPPSKISTFQQSCGNKLHRTQQSGEATSEELLVNVRQKESAKPSRNMHSTKPELRHHQQSCLALTSVVPSATDSLELELV